MFHIKINKLRSTESYSIILSLIKEYCCYCHILFLSYWEILKRLEEIAGSFNELLNFEYTVPLLLY